MVGVAWGECVCGVRLRWLGLDGSGWRGRWGLGRGRHRCLAAATTLLLLLPPPLCSPFYPLLLLTAAFGMPPPHLSLRSLTEKLTHHVLPGHLVASLFLVHDRRLPEPIKPVEPVERGPADATGGHVVGMVHCCFLQACVLWLRNPLFRWVFPNGRVGHPRDVAQLAATRFQVPR